MGKPRDKHKKKKWRHNRRCERIKLKLKKKKYRNISNSILKSRIHRNIVNFISPKELDFIKNPEITIEYFSRIRRAKSDEPMRIDLIPLENLSPSCVVVLAAEMNRHALNGGGSFIIKDYKKWCNSVKEQLMQIGFFKYMKMRIKDNYITNDRIWLNLCSYNNFKNVNNYINDIKNKILCIIPENIMTNIVKTRLYSVLYESLANTFEHAYPSYRKWTSEKNRWWCAASYNKINKVLQIIVYDMGITIPQSIRNKYKIEDNKVIEIVERKYNFLNILPTNFMEKFRNHGEIIKDMIQTDDDTLNHGNSATKLANRGHGLYKMRDFIKKYFKNGEFSIISNKGYCIFCINNGIEDIRSYNFNSSLQGTLIEWKIVL